MCIDGFNQVNFIGFLHFNLTFDLQFLEHHCLSFMIIELVNHLDSFH
jgi:hypothetical protein